MAHANDSEAFVRECIRLALQTEDARTREQLFQMARRWMELVMEQDN